MSVPTRQRRSAVPAPRKKKPFYRRWWFIALVIVVALVVIGLATGGGGDQPAAQSAAQSGKATTTEAMLVPDVVGMKGDAAKAALVAAGITAPATMEDAAGEEGVWDASNWTVTAQDPAAGTSAKPSTAVTLKVHHDTPEPASGASSDSGPTENSQGLSNFTARQECADQWETALKNQYPASKVKIHSTLGVLAETLGDDDRWFIKMEASVDDNTVDVECYVSGTEDDPVVEEGNVY